MAKTTKGTREDNRRKIIETAMAMISEKGVDKTSLAQISKASGVSKGTLYYY
jgi:AcrR family transcriptional regulator